MEDPKVMTPVIHNSNFRIHLDYEIRIMGVMVFGSSRIMSSKPAIIRNKQDFSEIKLPQQG
jgi:hypothetical protein